MIFDLSLDPTLLRLGPLGVTWPGLGYAIALGVVARAFARHAAEARLPRAVLPPIAVWALLAGLGGVLLGRFLAHPTYFLARPGEVPRFWEGGCDAHLAAAAAVLGAGLAARRHRAAFGATLARSTPALLLGLAIVAIGSFLGGAIWGGATSGMWGVVYWHPATLLPPGLIGVPLHPAPLYRAAAALALAAPLAAARRRDNLDGLRLWSIGIGGYASLSIVVGLGVAASDHWLAATGGIALALVGGCFLLLSRRPLPAGGAKVARMIRPGVAVPTTIAILCGLALQTAPLPESPGRWEGDPARAAIAERTWIVDYAIASPRVGDRISTGLYLALAEGEQRWAAAYLDRQGAALARADATCAASATSALLRHYRALVGATDTPPRLLRLLLDDAEGPSLRARAAQELAQDAQANDCGPARGAGRILGVSAPLGGTTTIDGGKGATRDTRPDRLAGDTVECGASRDASARPDPRRRL